MSPCSKFRFVLVATLWVCGGFGLYGQASSGSPHRSLDGPGDETGFPGCYANGSMPDGVNPCWCEPRIARGVSRNAKHEPEVYVPDGEAEILGCGAIAYGFKVSLAKPDTGAGNYGMNQIDISGSGRSWETFQNMIDAWHRLPSSSQQDDVSDEQLDEPEQMSLSSLPALDIKSVRTGSDSGKIIAQQIIANNPHKDIVYSITLNFAGRSVRKEPKAFLRTGGWLSLHSIRRRDQPTTHAVLNWKRAIGS